MVATVLRLRYRALANTLLRNPWQLVGFCAGVLWAISILFLAATGLVAAALLQGAETARLIVVVGGAVLTLGWVVGPIVVAGMESTVDAERLAPFPLTRRQVQVALAAVGLTGVPGIVTTLVALMTVILWVRWPAAAVVAVPMALVGVVTAVIAARLTTTLATGLGGSRRGRELVGTLVLAVLMLSGPIVTGLLVLLDAGGDVGTRMQTAADVLAWTPLGAAWSVPADVAAGLWLPAVARLAIAIGTPIILWLLWARALESSRSAGAGRASRTVASGAVGWFGRMPTGPVGATWARSLTAWLRDPRYLRQLLLVPLFPALFLFISGTQGALFAASAVLVALVLAIACYTDISYDGTAFASVLATGIRGRDDRLGRVLGAACLGVPLVILVAVVTAAVSGSATATPAVLAAALSVLLVGYGVSAVSSALIVSPVAAPGDSPFKSVPGQTFVGSLLVFVVLAAIAVVSSPALVLSIVSITSGSAVLGWIALAVGVVLGGVTVAVGVYVGGRTLDRTGPSLLARIRAFPR